MMSHSPLRMFRKYHDKCVLVSGQGPVLDIAKKYPFILMYTVHSYYPVYYHHTKVYWDFDFFLFYFIKLTSTCWKIDRIFFILSQLSYLAKETETHFPDYVFGSCGWAGRNIRCSSVIMSVILVLRGFSLMIIDKCVSFTINS